MKEVIDKSADGALDQSLSHFVDNINMALTTISQKLVSSAPEAAHLLLKAIQLQAIIDIVSGVAQIAIGYLFFSKIIPKLMTSLQVSEANGAQEVLYASATIGSGIISVVFFFHGILSVFLSQNLVAVFSPEAALAMKALSVAGIN